MQPTVTVLLSVFNGERYLRHAIESILNQSFDDFEFLIINDASTDRSRDILLSYPDRRIRLVDNSSNIGLTASLNLGLDLAAGEYVARLDADDISHAERLKKQVFFLRDRPATAVLATGCHIVDEAGNLTGTIHPPVSEHEIKWRLLFYNCLPHSSIMFRKKEIMSLGGYNKDIQYAQDYDLWLRTAELYRIEALSEPLMSYRLPDKGAISHDKKNEQSTAAGLIRLNNLHKLGIEAELTGGVQELCEFLFFNGALHDAPAAELLFRNIFRAFCASDFTSGLTAEKKACISKNFKARLANFFLQRAWEQYQKNDLCAFRRQLRESIRHHSWPASLPLILILIKSFFGKTAFEAIHRLRKKISSS